jgi:hypothetical protein
LPGSGLYFTETIPPAPHVHAGHRANFVLVVVGAILILAIIFAMVAH